MKLTRVGWLVTRLVVSKWSLFSALRKVDKTDTHTIMVRYGKVSRATTTQVIIQSTKREKSSIITTSTNYEKLFEYNYMLPSAVARLLIINYCDQCSGKQAE